MDDNFLLNLSELAKKRAIVMREDAQLWDILSRDLVREVRKQSERSHSKQASTSVVHQRPQERTEQIDGRLFVCISEAAAMMGIGRSSLYNEISASRIRVRKCGRRTLISISDIQTWFDSLPDGGE